MFLGTVREELPPGVTTEGDSEQLEAGGLAFVFLFLFYISDFNSSHVHVNKAFETCKRKTLNTFCEKSRTFSTY